MQLDIWSIGIIIIVFQGLFLFSILMASKDKRQKRGSIYLMLTILVLIWFLAEFFTIRNKIDIGFNLFYGTRYGSWFLLGPLTYFYFKSITDSQWKFSKWHWLHFLPFLIFVIIIPYIAYKGLNDRQINYGMLSVFDHREKVLTAFQWMYSFVFILQFVHLGSFLIRNLNIVKTYSKGLKAEYSNIDTKTKWLKYFNLVLLIILTFSAVFLYILLVTDIYRRHLDYIYVLPIGVLFYFISFKFMRTEWKHVEPNDKYSGSSLNADEIPKYTVKLDQLITKEKVYLNPALRLNHLAERLSISKHHLSQIINQHYGMSFFDFINEHRINEAKTLISNHPEYTLLKVAFESGFNNKTSFVNAFKKFESMTPSKYRDTLRY
ncbi:helix-turn-helix domain-containing protein [uncultured Psychroserpens sp.]|uniref:AraC family transcriptional regulator n=1 Tax=uncultured Psychroserpens sp. TaxID=255436 RepID=UPI002607E918|nr:helix-turn-helix domain-containing protein [uncultured Psychroserpens sp.]